MLAPPGLREPGWEARYLTHTKSGHSGHVTWTAVLPPDVFPPGREGRRVAVGVTGLWYVWPPRTLPATPDPFSGLVAGKDEPWPHSPVSLWAGPGTPTAEGLTAQSRVQPFPAFSGLSWPNLPPQKLPAQAHDSSKEGRGWPVTPQRKRQLRGGFMSIFPSKRATPVCYRRCRPRPVSGFCSPGNRTPGLERRLLLTILGCGVGDCP